MILRKMSEKRLRLIAESLEVSDYINSAVCSMQIDEYYLNGLHIYKGRDTIRWRRCASTADIMELRLRPDYDWYWIE